VKHRSLRGMWRAVADAAEAGGGKGSRCLNQKEFTRRSAAAPLLRRVRVALADSLGGTGEGLGGCGVSRAFRLRRRLMALWCPRSS